MGKRRRSDKSSDGSNSKHLKMETNSSTSSTKVENDCPISILPLDILAKIIAHVPIAEWPALELTDTKIFRPATLIAWRELRVINVERDCMIKSEIEDDDTSSSYGNVVIAVKSILQMLVERSPFLSSLSGLDIRLGNARSNSDVINLLVQFEHLRSLSLGDAKFFAGKRGIPLESVVELLESTRSRASLTELRLFKVAQGRNRATLLDQFAASFADGREIREPLKLEKFELSSFDHSVFHRLDTTMDTTRLIDLRLRKASIEPHELASLIRSASKLRHIEFAFLMCSSNNCKTPSLQVNKELLSALASCENLTAIKFDCIRRGYNDVKCMNFGVEFIEMLKSIGRRGQLEKLAMEERFVRSSTIEMKEICATICTHVPSLRSIKLYVGQYSNTGSVYSIVNMTDLEEIHIIAWDAKTPVGAMKKFSQLPHLKRLIFDELVVVDKHSLKDLADAPALTDLRIGFSHTFLGSGNSTISADVLEKWADGFASNLECLMLNRMDEKDKHVEKGLVRVLEKAVGLRVLILNMGITKRSLTAIAKSCPELEVLDVRMACGEKISVRHLQKIVDRCPKLTSLGGIGEEIRNELHVPKYRKIGKVDMGVWKHDFDGGEW